VQPHAELAAAAAEAASVQDRFWSIGHPVPTVCTPAQLDAVVAAAMRVLSAVIEVAAIKVSRKL
jgi:hypothetical protein